MNSFVMTETRGQTFAGAIRKASPLLWWTSLCFLVGFAVCAALGTLDPRLFNGIGVWVKPAKFFFSLAVHMLTLCFGIALLPEHRRNARSTVAAITVVRYPTGRDARGATTRPRVRARLVFGVRPSSTCRTSATRWSRWA